MTVPGSGPIATTYSTIHLQVRPSYIMQVTVTHRIQNQRLRTCKSGRQSNKTLDFETIAEVAYAIGESAATPGGKRYESVAGSTISTYLNVIRAVALPFEPASAPPEAVEPLKIAAYTLKKAASGRPGLHARPRA